jgi:hypothetical protein
MPRRTHATLCGGHREDCCARPNLRVWEVLTASLQISRPWLRQGEKQDPPGVLTPKGSNRSTSVAADGRAASAQHDRSI